MKNIGTMSIGVRMPILKYGDNLIEETVKSVLEASNEIDLEIEDSDVIAITESILARTEGNYVTVSEIAEDIKKKINDMEVLDPDYVTLYQPVLSRNRFATVLKAFARVFKRIRIIFTAPTDEVGNELLDRYAYLKEEHDSYTQQSKLKELAENFIHPFTGINYVKYYKEIIESEGAEFEYRITEELPIITSSNLVICNVHDRNTLKQIYSRYTGNNVYTLEDFCKDKCSYGLLGCNKVDEETVKLFPKDPETFVENLKKKFYEITGKNVECMVYGDGGFKCPVCGVWEELDPVISPGYTKGLSGTPNEIKLKYFADNKYKNLSGEDLREAIETEIKSKDSQLKGNMSSQGTTPRQITDLLGSLSDLTSGSGDKGTPCIWIKGYFKNYTTK